ncbi:YdcF family protein [Novosphingobium sp.]|uniref:YdcF family protein n=1 Tax=Novosphingobium sp. TaxID=1874826 RepID=UPI00286AD920|nr:YdcF family protein [Novosphingobium sp.]
MLRRILSLILIAWAAGFILFAISLPQPAAAQRTDAVVVLTGGAGRIERGLEVLHNGWARQMLVSGVDPQVKPGEFAAQFKIAPAAMKCCITLGYRAFDTTSNAKETAAWMKTRGYRSVRVVTSDWHLRRARAELAKVLPAKITVVDDAVHTQPSLRILMVEYHKLLFRSVPGLKAS